MVISDEKIIEFDVSVDDAIAMEKIKNLNNLKYI